MMENWKAIQDSYHMVASGAVKRIDGEGFSVYSAGTIIRIDIKQEAK
jgi:hypothetical protein